MAKEESVDTSKTEAAEEQPKAESKKSRKASAMEKQIEDLQNQLAAEQQKTAEYLDMARRVQADFENFRRRTDRENEDRRRFAALDIVKDLLNVADDLGRALENANPDDPLATGVKGVRDNLVKILESQGVKEIPTDGAFDPNLHEALAMVDADEEGKIAMVAQKGYTMHDKVIRYAKVVVTRKKEEPAAPAPEEGPADATKE